MLCAYKHDSQRDEVNLCCVPINMIAKGMR
jgi:hypothetical protein